MASIESRIVTMKFDNKSFEQNAGTTLATLAKVRNAMDLGATSKITSSLGRIGESIKGFSFGNMGAQVDGISGKFLALGTIAVTALTRIANTAITAGLNFAKQFSGLNAMQEGFAEYETKMGSIQAILANTKGESLKSVGAALNELNRYSDQTIYNFGEMVSNIKTFTVAGIDLETSVASVKGLANVAALTGTNAQEAAHATYQMAQAMSSGAVRLQDWISMEKAGGMAGKVFQDSLLRTARNHGVAVDDMIKKNGSFRLSLQEGWLTTEILNETLGQWAGAYDKAQLKQMGYSESQARAILKLQRQAQASAQDVKTFTALISTVKESMASGWAQTWETVFGDLKEATALWTGINDVVSGFVNKSAEARNAVLKDWAKLGGRTAVFNGIGNIFKALFAIIKPIHEAFRDIFPPKTGEQLASMSKAFENFTKKLIIGEETAENIGDTFRGIFSILKIFLGVIGGVISYVLQFFGILASGTGDADGLLNALLAITGAIGNVATAIHDWLMEGAKLEKFFDMIISARNAVLAPMVGIISRIVQAFVALASGNVAGFFDHLGGAGQLFLDVLGIIGDRLGEFGSGLAGVASDVASFFAGIASGGASGIASIFDTVADAFGRLRDALDFGDGGGGSSALSAVGDAAEQAGQKLDKASWIVEAAKGVWEGLGNVFSALGSVAGPVLTNIGRVLVGVSDAFATFAENMDLTDLVAIVNTGVFVMLYRSITRFVDGLSDMTGIGSSVSGAFDQLTSSLKTMQNAVRAEMIKSIAIAVGILAASLIGLSFIPQDKLQSALLAITALMGQVMLMMVGMGKLTFGIGVLTIGPAMIGIATAILILAGALHALEGVSWESIGKAGAVLAGLSLALAGLGAMGPAVAAGGAAIFLVAPAMIMISAALMAFQAVKWESIGKASVVLLALGLALAGLGAVGPAVLAGGAAMLLAAPAMVMMAAALVALQLVKWSSIGKLAVVLGALALGLTAMIAAIPGALALNMVAFGLNALMPPLLILSTMSFGEIVGSLAKLGLGLMALGLTAGLVSPLLLLLGTAVTLLGVGMLAAGAGMFLFGTGLGLVAAAGTAAFAVLIGGITSFLVVLPQWVLQFGQALTAIATVIQTSGPALVQAFATLIDALIEAIIPLIPKLRRLMVVLIKNGLQAIRETFPDVVKTGFAMLMALLNGIDNNIQQIVDKATDIAVKFMDGIGRNAPRLIKAGVKMIKDVAKGIANEIIAQGPKLFEKAKEIGKQIINGILGGLDDLKDTVIDKAKDIGGSIISGLGDAVGLGSPSRYARRIAEYVDEGLVIGLDARSREVAKAADRVGRGAVIALRQSMENAERSLPDLDLRPTVSPVLDLSEMAREASKISGVLGKPTVAAELSFNRAQGVATEVEDTRETATQAAAETREVIKEVKLEQHNHSPKALDSIEIYRNTKNLISLTKEALNKP